MRYDLYELPTSPLNSGRTVFLLGQSEDGPINAPIPVKSLEQAKSVFGSIDKGDLVRAYQRISRIPDITVYLMRVTGQYSRGSLIGLIGNQEEAVIKFRSKCGGEFYNSINVYIGQVPVDDVLKDAVIVQVPSSLGMGRAYVIENYDNIGQLLHDINYDTRMGRNFVYASSGFSSSPISCLLGYNSEPMALVGGDDGLEITKDDLYIALEESYGVLEGREIDIICPVGARFDDATPVVYNNDGQVVNAYITDDHLALQDTENGNQFVTFHEQLINFCKVQEQTGVHTHGVLGLREVLDPTDILKHEYGYILQLVNATAFKDRYGLIEFENGVWIDKGHYITIVAGDLIYDEGTADEHFANGCDLYAGLIASLKEDETTTNKPLPAGVKLRFELKENELKELAAIGVTSFRESIKYGPVVANGVTASLPQSPLHIVGNIRMVQLTIRAVNAAIDDLIGESFNPIVTAKEMHKRIESVLGILKQMNVLKGYRFNVESYQSSQTARVNLELLTKYSAEFIPTTSVVALTQQKGV